MIKTYKNVSKNDFFDMEAQRLEQLISINSFFVKPNNKTFFSYIGSNIARKPQVEICIIVDNSKFENKLNYPIQAYYE